MIPLLKALWQKKWAPISLALLILIIGDWLLSLHAPDWVGYVVYWITILALPGWLTYKYWVHEIHDETKMLVMGFVFGVSLGVVMAIYRAATLRELWTLFNLVAEPLRTGLSTLLVVWVVSNIYRDQNKSDSR